MTLDRPPIRHDGLQLHEHRRFQEAFWTVERVAWACFAIVIAAASLGLTGSGGPLSTATAKLASGEVTHPVISRWDSSDTLIVGLDQASAQSATIGLSSGFIRRFVIERIQPEPQRSQITPRGPIYGFDRSGGGQIVFHVRPRHPGLARYTLTLDGHALDLSTYILP